MVVGGFALATVNRRGSLSVPRAIPDSQSWIRFVNEINTRRSGAPGVLYSLASQYAGAVASNYPGFLQSAINQDHALSDALQEFDAVCRIASTRRTRFRVVAL